MPMVATPLCFWKLEKLQAIALSAVSAMFFLFFRQVSFSISYRLVSLTLELIAPFIVGTSCESNTNVCCDGLVCTELTHNFSQCPWSFRVPLELLDVALLKHSSSYRLYGIRWCKTSVF